MTAAARNRLRSSLVASALLMATAAPAAAGPAGMQVPGWKIWGHSVKDRPIRVRRSGEASSPFKVLVVGSMHGDEPQGMRVVDRLNRTDGNGVRGVDLWTIRTVNPDGIRRRSRKNARGVDLNRNFPFHFDPDLDGGYNSGPGPLSEPEARTVARIARHGDFDLAIWYHQPWDATLIPCNSVGRAARRYSKLSGLAGTRRCDPYVPGSVIGWMHHRFRTAAFVVELDAGTLSSLQVRRHARAVVQLAREMRPPIGG